MKNLMLIIPIAWLLACSASEVPKRKPAEAAKATPISQKDTTKQAPEIIHNVGGRNAEAMVAAGFRRYGVEKGSLLYRIDGTAKGVEAIYFDNWGWREARYQKMDTDAGYFKEKTDKVSYLDGERRFEYDPKTNTAQYFDSPQVEESAKKYGTKDMVQVGIEMIKKMGGVPAGTGKLADIECDKWAIKQYNTTLWMWKGITMGEESFAMNLPIGRRVLSVKLEDPIEEAKLTLPGNVKIVAGQ